MSLVTFVPAPGFSGEQGVVNAGGGISFDIGAALATGGGQIVVDNVASSILAGVLSRYPGLIVQGTSPGSQPNVDVISAVQAHSLRLDRSAAQVGDALVKGPDGLYLPAVFSGAAGSPGAPGGPPVTYQTVSPSGGDDTANIKAAISAVVTAGQANGSNYGEVWFDATKGPFQVGAAPTQGGATHGNAQIPLPVIPTTGQKFTLVLRGVRNATGLWHWQQTTPQAGGAVIQSTLAGTNDATYGEATVIGGPNPKGGYGCGGNGTTFSNMLIVVEGIEILVPNDPHVCGFDFRGVAEMHFLNGSCMANAVVGTVATPTATWQFGFATPEVNNNANVRIGTYSCEGMNYGALINEHCVADLVNTGYCTAGVEVNSSGISAGSAGGATSMPYGCLIHRLLGQTNQVDLGSLGAAYPTRVDVYQLNSEAASFASVNDPGNVLIGEIRYANAGVVNVNQPPGVSGAIRGSINLRVLDSSRVAGHVAAPAVPATTVALLNPFWRDAAVTVTGGTVTVIAVDGTATGLTGGTVIVPSGKAITLTYSVAPAWSWVLL